jgi:drug/metabolite transporter (DMT)-like permease
MHRLDALLALMVLIWGVNYSVIKHAFTEMPPQPFNALRLIIASAVFLVAIRVSRGRSSRSMSSIFFTPHSLTSRETWDLVWLGVVGHCFYQFCFVGGVALTSVSNAALIIGATPVAVAIASAAMGHERITVAHWMGAAVSVTGIYLVVGHGASFGGQTLTGDLLVVASVACWATYTLGSGRLIGRHSPLFVTGITMAIGGLPYVAFTLPQFMTMDWSAVSALTWLSLVLSALLALNVAYLIWYIGVQRLGAARTSMYSNLVPLVAMGFASLMLDEPMTRTKILGAVAVMAGVVLTRFAKFR